jgi:hypothetical protein
MRAEAPPYRAARYQPPREGEQVEEAHTLVGCVRRRGRRNPGGRRRGLGDTARRSASVRRLDSERQGGGVCARIEAFRGAQPDCPGAGIDPAREPEPGRANRVLRLSNDVVSADDPTKPQMVPTIGVSNEAQRPSRTRTPTWSSRRASQAPTPTTTTTARIFCTRATRTGSRSTARSRATSRASTSTGTQSTASR